MKTSEKLEKLRKVLIDHGLDGYIVPRADEYQSEFPPPYAERLRWLTGFSGSAGFAIILADKAVVMSDGRYVLQLKDQVDSAFFQTADSTKITAAQWLSEHAAQGAVIGFDPWLHSAKDITKIEEGLVASANMLLKPVNQNLIDMIWEDQPERSFTPVSLFPEKVSGKNSQEKCADILETLKEKGADFCLITAPDSIAWVLNIRARDTDFIPLAFSYLILNASGEINWFIDKGRLSTEIKEKIGAHLNVYDPNRIEKYLSDLGGEKVIVDRAKLPFLFARVLEQAEAEILDETDPCLWPKACKTPSEISSMQAVHIADGVAVVMFLKWLEQEGQGKTELEAQMMLEALRAPHLAYQHPSFPTICGYGSNGAIIHYRASEETNQKLEGGSFLLVDSGGQYAGEYDGQLLYGTTDITRSMAIGDISHDMKENFTRVLKGMIALSMAKFPAGTTGAQLDVLARSPLWSAGLDYAHGTGHGVGCYLDVHEASASLSPRGKNPLKPGMILSNEPGYYKEGAYGVRHENLITVVERGHCDDTGKDMLGFETLTMVPFDTSAIIPEMLSTEEKNWINEYHKDVFDTLSPHLNNAERSFLQRLCTPLK